MQEAGGGSAVGIRHRPFSLSLISLLLIGSVTISCDDAMSRFIGSREREKRERVCLCTQATHGVAPSQEPQG